MAVCQYCGAQVPMLYCPSCGQTNVIAQEAPSLTSTTPAPDVRKSKPVVIVRDDGFYRTPLQVFVLTFATFGAYELYYLIRGRRLAQLRLDEKPDSYWLGLVLIVPLANLWYWFNSFGKLGDRVSATDIGPPEFWPLALGILVIDSLWKLPDPWGWLCFSSPILLAIIHQSVARAERADAPGYVWPSLTWVEWSIIVLGTILYALSVSGMMIDTDVTTKIVVFAVTGAIALSAIPAYLMSRGLADPIPSTTRDVPVGTS
jgi:hypothetical protein